MVGMSTRLGTASRIPLLPLAILGASVGAIVMAFTAQYVFGLEPCILCLYQRVPFAITAVLAALALLPFARGRSRRWLMAACGVVFLAGSALAFYHVGVEQHWWSSVTACGGAPSTGMSVKDLTAQLSAGAAAVLRRGGMAAFRCLPGGIQCSLFAGVGRDRAGRRPVHGKDMNGG